MAELGGRGGCASTNMTWRRLQLTVGWCHNHEWHLRPLCCVVFGGRKYQMILTEKKHCNKWISCRCKHNHPKTQLTNTILNCSNTSYNLTNTILNCSNTPYNFTNTILNCSNTPYNFTNTILNCSNTLYGERMNALTPRKETMYKVSDFLLISSSKVLNLKW